MSRLQKKCLVASSMFHGLLILVLLFGSALMPKPEETPSKSFKMYNSATVSELATGGGDLAPETAPAPQAHPAPPEVANPQPAVTLPAPAPTPEVSKPKPIVEVPHAPPRIVEPKLKRVADIPKPKLVEQPETHWYDFGKTKTKPAVTEEPAPPAKHKILIDKNDLAMHKSTEKLSNTTSTATAEANKKASQRRIAKELSDSVRTLGKDLGPSSMVDLRNVGDGSGGQASVNYGDVIISKYLSAWSPPADLDDNQPIVSAAVTIARDGSVITAHVTKGSGNRSMDRSIENALQTVTFIEPFPAAWKEAQRTVTVRFNLQLKRQNG